MGHPFKRGRGGRLPGTRVLHSDQETHYAWESVADFAPAPRDGLVEVTARNVTGRDDTAFGVVCRVSANHGYQLVIFNNGEYGILREGGEGTVGVVLADARSSLIPVGAAAYRIGASCVGDQLSLFVNCKKIASIKDKTFVSGSYGLAADTISGVHGPREVRFTKFVVRAP